MHGLKLKTTQTMLFTASIEYWVDLETNGSTRFTYSLSTATRQLEGPGCVEKPDWKVDSLSRRVASVASPAFFVCMGDG